MEYKFNIDEKVNRYANIVLFTSLFTYGMIIGIFLKIVL